MDQPSHNPPSFSRWRRWGIALQVVLVVGVVLAVVVMVNYLSHDYYARWHVSANAHIQLAPRTVRLLQSLTNNVRVTLYYDKDEPFYSTILDLLNEYRAHSSKLSLHLVDYKRDPGAALQLKTKYRFLEGPAAKNLVIFDCEGHGVQPVDGNALTKYVMEQLVPNEKEREFRRKPTTFEGERAFTAALLKVTNPKPLRACFLKGHGEHELENADPAQPGFYKFATVLAENYIQPESFSLLGTNTVPADALLVIAGAVTPLSEFELEKVEQFLNQGGRLMVLLNFIALRNSDAGLEKLLAKWGIETVPGVIIDEENTVTRNEVFVQKFNPTHPLVNPLLGKQINMVMPRPVGKAHGRTPAADAPQVDELAFTGPHSFVKGSGSGERKAYPVIAAVEKGGIKGVVTERGTTRILAAGDSIFLTNEAIETGANRDFAALAANWLLDRPQLLQDLSPRPVTEYRLFMTNRQLQTTEWLLLAAMPGAALLVGCVISFRRRR